jgi:hypothetical protein
MCSHSALLILTFRCTAIPSSLDAHAIPRTPRHLVTVKAAFDYQVLWFQYGINVESTVRIHAYR